MVGREAKQAQVCLLWYSAMPAVWLCGKESRQTRKFACFGIARCKTLWLCGKESRKTRKFACFGIARCKTRCLGGKQSVCLPALVQRGAKRYGWAGSKAGKLASLLALVWRDGNAMVGREAQQANSQVCLLWYSAMPHGMVGWERKQANSKVACFGIARCKTLWFGGKQSRQTRKLACFGRARCETHRLAGNQSLPWYSTRQDAMVGREQSRQTRKFAGCGIARCKTLSKLASLLALV